MMSRKSLKLEIERLVMPLSALSVLLAAAAAQSAPANGGSHHFARLFISPMGEPFYASEQSRDALADWFNQADRNHDGQLTADEMEGDADRFFAQLDTNHDGEVDPDEITHYEDVIAPEVRTGFVAGFVPEGTPGVDGEGDARGGGHRHSHGGSGSWRGGRNDGSQGAAKFGLLDLPEPVTAADTDFNRGVSKDEFEKAALQRFTALDVARQGRLTLAVLESLRPAPPPQPNKQDDDQDIPPPPDPDGG